MNGSMTVTTMAVGKGLAAQVIWQIMIGHMLVKNPRYEVGFLLGQSVGCAKIIKDEIIFQGVWGQSVQAE